MNTRPLIPLCLAGAIALACGSRSTSSATPSARPFTTRLATAAVAPAVAAPRPRPVSESDTVIAHRLRPTFSVTHERGEVHFLLAIRNLGKKDIELAFPSGQTYDFAILDERGREVYRWGNGRMFTQSLQNRMLDGGDTMEIEETATPALPAGSYTAVATLRSSNFPLSERVALAIP